MHAVLVTVDIDAAQVEEATEMLRSSVVPRVKEADGFVRGTWTRVQGDEGVTGRSMILFESEEHARAAARSVVEEGPPPEAPVSVRSVDVAEVVAEA